MDNKQTTQNNVNMCKKGIAMEQYGANGFRMKYSGEVIILPLEEETRRRNAMESLREKLSKQEEETKKLKMYVRQMEQQLKAEQEKSAQMLTEIRNLQSANTSLTQQNADLQGRLAKFGGGRKTSKLTPEVQQYIQQSFIQGYSVTQIFNSLAKQGWDISYETVRRYISTLRQR